jgi:hypothetical protein
MRVSPQRESRQSDPDDPISMSSAGLRISLVVLNRFAWILFLLSALVAASLHMALLIGGGGEAFDLTRYPLLALFVIICVVFVRSEPRPMELHRLNSNAAKRVFWGGLLAIWLVYTVLVVLDNLGYPISKSLFGDRLSRLWFTSGEVWVFASAAGLLRIRRGDLPRQNKATRIS